MALTPYSQERQRYSIQLFFVHTFVSRHWETVGINTDDANKHVAVITPNLVQAGNGARTQELSNMILGVYRLLIINPFTARAFILSQSHITDFLNQQERTEKELIRNVLCGKLSLHQTEHACYT
jgi:hypothetical protein